MERLKENFWPRGYARDTFYRGYDQGHFNGFLKGVVSGVVLTVLSALVYWLAL